MEIIIQINKQLGTINAYDDRAAKTYTIEELRNLASKGDNEAQKAMGDYFFEIKNDGEAMVWYKKAAENGNAKAQWHLGARYFAGWGVKKDLSQAEYWFRKSAEQGDAGGQHGLGGCYHAKHDFVNAKHWLEKAAAQGHADAKSALEAVSLLVKSNYTSQQHEQYLQQKQEKKRIAEEERQKRIADFRKHDFASVSAGSSHTVGLKADGTVVAAGGNEKGQCNVGNWRDITAISAGDNCTFGLKSDGTVVAVGDNSDGQCNVGGWRGIVSISAKGRHIVGLKEDGTVVAAGDNEKGQCNVDNWRDIVSVSANDGYTAGVKADGTVLRSGWCPYNFDFSNVDFSRLRKISSEPKERHEGKYCPFYDWDENVCRPSDSDVGDSYKPYCQGDNNWKACDIYQRARKIQEMLNELNETMDTDVKPKWL